MTSANPDKHSDVLDNGLGCGMLSGLGLMLSASEVEGEAGQGWATQAYTRGPPWQAQALALMEAKEQSSDSWGNAPARSRTTAVVPKFQHREKVQSQFYSQVSRTETHFALIL